MEGILPLSLSLSDASARVIGAYVRLGLVDVVRPRLDTIDEQLRILNRAVRVLIGEVIDSAGHLQQRLRVEVMNEDLLDHVEATRWAVAYLSYNTFLELLDLLGSMRWLDGRSHIHLHDIIAGLRSLEGAVAAFAFEVTFIGNAVVVLLQAILDQLRQGIGITGQIQIVLSTGGLGDFLKTLDLWKLLGLLGLLAVGLGLIVAFLFGVGAALATFGAKAILAAAAIGVLVAALIPLMTTIAGFKWEDLAKIGLGFAGIAGFVFALGKAFAAVTSDLKEIVPQLEKFFTAIAQLMTTLAGFDWGDLAKIGAGFAGIAGFVFGLGKAFGAVTSNLKEIVPQLEKFFTAIAQLMTTLAGFDVGDLIKIGVGFAGIAGFVYGLGRALATLTDRALAALPALDKFFTAITRLMSTLAGTSWPDLAKIGLGFVAIAGFVYGLGRALATLTDRALAALPALAQFFDAMTRLMSVIASFSVGQLIAIAAGFLLIAGFIYGLALALNTLSEQSITALPGLGQLLDSLGRLAKLMADMSVGEMVTMGIGLALIAAFVWAVALALVYAAGPLNALAKIFESFGKVLGAVADIAGRVWGVIKDIGGAIGDFFGWVGEGVGDVFSGIDIEKMRAQYEAQQAASAVPAAPAAPMAALPAPPAAGLGPLAPGGALAAAPPGAPETVDQSVNVTGGINVAVNADRLEADSAALLSDNIVAQLQQRLGTLRAQQDFRVGARPTA